MKLKCTTRDVHCIVSNFRCRESSDSFSSQSFFLNDKTRFDEECNPVYMCTRTLMKGADVIFANLRAISVLPHPVGPTWRGAGNVDISDTYVMVMETSPVRHVKRTIPRSPYPSSESRHATNEKMKDMCAHTYICINKKNDHKKVRTMSMFLGTISSRSGGGTRFLRQRLR